MNTRARRAVPFYIFLPSSFLCASWHKFCCKPSLCKDNFSQTASHILKQLCTSSSEQRLDEGRDGFTFGALYLATAWLRSKVAQVTPRCDSEERFSSFCHLFFFFVFLFEINEINILQEQHKPLSLSYVKHWK